MSASTSVLRGDELRWNNPLVKQRASPSVCLQYDPNRHPRAQMVRWRPDGTPDFGVPVADGSYHAESN